MMSKHKKKHSTKNKKRHNPSKLKRYIIIILIILLIIIKVFSNQKNTEISIILNNEEITQDLSNRLFEADNIVYMSFEDISKYIDKTIYKEDNLIITTSSKKVASLELEKSKITINGSEKTILAGPIKIEENIFLPISELQSVYDIDFSYSRSSNIATIDDLSTKKVVATAKNKLSIKKEKSFFSKTLTKVKKEDTVVYISEEGKWSKVMTKDGYIGYVKTKKLTNVKTEREEFKIEEGTKNNEYLEKDITDKDITNFKKRQELIENIFTEAIKNDKMQIKLICKGQDENFKRLEIEAKPVFNECGISSEFIKIQ